MSHPEYLKHMHGELACLLKRPRPIWSTSWSDWSVYRLVCIYTKKVTVRALSQGIISLPVSLR